MMRTSTGPLAGCSRSPSCASTAAELRQAGCSGDRIVLAVTPYATGSQREAAIAALLSSGYRRTRTDTVGGSWIVQFLKCR